MTPPRVLIFYSHEQDKPFWSELLPSFYVSAFLLDQDLEECYPDHEPSVIIVFDSSKEEEGTASLQVVGEAFPNTPLILAVENPSKAYLLAALQYRVHTFFTLPLKKDALLKACLEAARHHHQEPWYRKYFTWWHAIWRHARSWHSPVGSKPEGASVASEKSLSPVPHLYLPKKLLVDTQDYDISVNFFGRLMVQSKYQKVMAVKGKKNITILAYLLFYNQKLTHRDVLMDKFWRDYTTSSAKNSLNVAICNIRKSLSKVFRDREVIIYDQGSYGLNPELKVVTDTDKFLYLWKEGSRVESAQGMEKALSIYNAALSCYKQEFLSNIRFDHWCEYERDNLKETYLYILNRLGNYFYEENQYEACINISKKMLIEDDCLEEVYRKLIRCYSITGLNDLAVRQYFKCKKSLRRELNMDPSESTEKLYHSLRMGKTYKAG